MGSKVGIVYATDSGMLRYWIVPDDDAEHDHHSKRVWPGESYLTVDRAGANEPPKEWQLFCEATIEKITGKPCPAPVRAALVDDTGAVVAVALIDPNLDPGLPPNERIAIVVDEKAEIGWAVAADGTLEAPLAEAVAIEASAEVKP